jgi:glyoxylase-like metal-dependent hydrolase (beta-lactamase superfamily II)
MSRDWRYERGLHSLGNGAYAYLQPDGGWGWSNAGLIESDGESLLVDTLFDERLTADMLTEIRDATGLGAQDIGTLVNTHAHGDHTHGNALLENATVVASEAGALEMEEMPPQALAEMLRNAPHLGATGHYLTRIFSGFDFESVRGKPPTHTFVGDLALRVGDLDVHALQVGPAHTAGDVIAHVPERGLVFTGDILFVDTTPIMWSGPVSNWLRACDRILALDADVIVPGHGPITDAAGVQAMRGYLEYIEREARKRFDAGLDVLDAALDIALGDYDSWGDAERIAANVDVLYREFRGDETPADPRRLFELMARIDLERRGRRTARSSSGDQ